MAGGSITKEGEFAVIRIPMAEVHGFRVALEPCPCRGSKSVDTENIRQRLNKGLARLQAGRGGGYGKE